MRVTHMMTLLILILRVGAAGTDLAAQQADTGSVVTSDGVRLHYRRLGAGSPVLVPGGFLIGSAFDTLAARHTLVLYDMRNRGASSAVADTAHLALADDVRDLEAVRAGLRLGKVDLIGVSYLGLVVALYALDHPATTGRLIQIAPVPRRWDTAYPDGLQHRDQPVDPRGWEELQRLYADSVAARDQARICAKEWEVLRVRLVGRPEAAQHLPDPCGYPNEWPRHLQVHFRASFGSVQRLALPAERLRAIRSPVLVIHGTWDRNAPYGGGRQWALELPDARLLTIPGAAHAPWADHGTEVTLALTRFLDGQWPDGAERVTRLVP